MINRIIDFCVANRFFVLVLTAVGCIAGWWSLRPKFMTVATTFLGLVPILWSIGVGSDVMKRIAAPMIGGIFTSFILELVVYPPIYQIWRWNFGLKQRLSAKNGALEIGRV